MPLSHIQTINPKWNMPLLLIKSTFTFQWESHWVFFSSIGCNSPIVSNKQICNVLATIWRAKLMGAHESSMCLTRTSMTVIGDYHHMTTMNENVKWMKLTYLLSILSLNLRVPLFYIYLYFEQNLIAFLHIYTLEKWKIPLYILCIVIPQILSLLKLTVSSYVVGMKSPLLGETLTKNWIENRTPLNVFMIIKSACVLTLHIEYLNPANCVHLSTLRWLISFDRVHMSCWVPFIDLT